VQTAPSATPGQLDAALADRNILLVTFDTVRADRIGCYGYEAAKTPVVDRLAEEGIRFSRCYSPVPVTLPAHASVLTGVYPIRHLLQMNTDGPLDAAIPTLAEALRDQGYRTGAVVGSVVLARDRGLDRGFEHYDDDAREMSASKSVHHASRRGDAVTAAAAAWLDTVGDDRWFLWVHYYDPHTPYDAPGTPASATLDEAYDAEIAYADAQLGRLLDRIAAGDKRTGRSTVIVFTADHGESLGQHGEATHGLFTYNATLHVPLIISTEALQRRGRVIDTAASLVDLMPTILSWIPDVTPRRLDGTSLIDLRGSEPDAAVARAIYFESMVGKRWYNWAGLRGVIVDNWKLIEAPTPELYDMDLDPDELHNRYGDEPKIVKRLRSALIFVAEAADLPPQSPGSDQSLTSERRRELESLGYVGSTHGMQPAAGGAPDPKDMYEVHRNYILGRDAAATGRYDEALRYYEAAFRADRNNPQVMIQLVELLNVPAAREAARQLLVQRVDEPQPIPEPYGVKLRVQLAVSFGQDSRFAEAARLLEAALKLDPDDHDANFYYGHTLLKQGAPAAQAQPYLDKARQMEKGDAP